MEQVNNDGPVLNADGTANFAHYASSASASRIICTYSYRKGLPDKAVWRADIAFTLKNASPTAIRGYHVWAVPYIRWMHKSTMAEKIMLPIAQWRAQELAYQMGVVSHGSWRGKLVRWVLEPMCWVIGVFTPK